MNWDLGREVGPQVGLCRKIKSDPAVIARVRGGSDGQKLEAQTCYLASEHFLAFGFFF
jgi:hypothetical protein